MMKQPPLNTLMNKIIIFFCCILFLYSCKKEKEINTDETKKVVAECLIFGLNGNVKNCVEYTTEQNRNEKSLPSSARRYENQSSKDVTLKFDSNGLLVNKLIYGEDSNITEDLIYDGIDRIISSKKFTSPTDFSFTKHTWEAKNNTIITRRITDGSLLDKEVFQYDKGLKINKLKFNSRDNITDKISYKYNTFNQLVEELYYRDKPNFQSRLAYEYNENSDKKTEASYDKNNDLVWKTNFEYNLNNDLISAKTFNPNGVISFEEAKDFDQKNRLITKKTYDSFENSNTKEVIEYDEKNNITKTIFYKNEVVISQSNYEYDIHNNLTLYLIIDATNIEIYRKEASYTYDDQANWVSKTTTLNKNLELFTSRKIEYYTY
ncbi:hypothetical protein [uncultured Flavobacterium sp.]|uniref:hypothetical protein n=1 Tax=uncultured Flavobacterium sp. TaxID=165435 RepID=UPI0030CA25C9